MSHSLPVRARAKVSFSFLFILTLTSLILIVSAASLNRPRTVSAAQQTTPAIAPASATRAQQVAGQLAVESYDALPLSFEPNRGQAGRRRNSYRAVRAINSRSRLTKPS